MHGVQVKMARAALDMSATELAKSAKLTRATVENFEHKDSALHRTVRAIQHVLEAKGVVLIDGSANAGPGIRLRQPISA